jgi:nitroreductase
VPVHVVVFLDRPKMRVERDSAADLFNFGATYGSIFPAIELMMLAARAVGVGTAMTTMLTSKESETKAILGVPEQYQLIALVPMGYPADPFKRPLRKSVSPRIHDERWDRAWPHV